MLALPTLICAGAEAAEAVDNRIWQNGGYGNYRGWRTGGGMWQGNWW